MDLNTLILGIFTLLTPFVGMWIKAKIDLMTTAAKDMKDAAHLAAHNAIEAADNAVEAKDNAAEAKVAAANTSDKLDIMHMQLDGTLSDYKKAMDDNVKSALARVDDALKRVDSAFERGRGVGHDEAALGPIAEGVAKVEEHLAAQDPILAEVHQAVVKNGPKEGKP